MREREVCKSESIGEKVKYNSSRAEVLMEKFSLNAAEATFAVSTNDKIITDNNDTKYTDRLIEFVIYQGEIAALQQPIIKMFQETSPH